MAQSAMRQLNHLNMHQASFCPRSTRPGRKSNASAPNAEGVCYLDDLVLSLSALGMHFFTLAVPERAKHMRRLWKGAPHFKSAASLGLRAQLPTTVALRRALGIVHLCVVSVWQTMGGYRL